MIRCRALAPLLILAALAGCSGVDYEAQGDDLVRRGDYYAAVDSYKQVPAGDGTPELGGKLTQATEDLREDAVKRAQRALDDGRFEEALKIARRGIDYVDDSRLHDIERQAKSGTVSKALETGKLHLQRGEFDEAISNFETALRYDSSASTKGLLLDAKAGGARKLAQHARQLAASQDFDGALGAISRALILHDAPEHRTVQTEIQAAKDRWLQQQFDRARGAGMSAVAKKEYAAAAAHFRTALQFGQAEDLAGRITYCESMAAGFAAVTARDLGEAVRRFNAAVETGYDQAVAANELTNIDREHARLISTGQQARESGQYEAALQSLRAAQEIRSDEPLEQWIRYCDHLRAGTAAMQQRDFMAAQEAFERAIAEKLQDQGVAERLRNGVRESTYTITLNTLTVHPFKSNDELWDGFSRRALRMEAILAGYKAARGEGAAKRAADAASLLIPPQNLPDLFIRITLPNGAVYRTELRKETLHTNVGAAFTITGHAYSDAPVVITVRDDDPPTQNDEAVGTWATTVGELIRNPNGGGVVNFEQVHELDYLVEMRSVDPVREPWTNGCTLEKAAPDTGAGAGTGDPAPPAGDVWLITVREIRVASADVPNEAGDGAPDAELTLSYDGGALLTAFAGENQAERRWESADAPAVTVTLPAGRTLQVVLADRDDTDSDIVITYDLDAAALAQGSIRLETENGSLVELTATKQ